MKKNNTITKSSKSYLEQSLFNTSTRRNIRKKNILNESSSFNISQDLNNSKIKEKEKTIFASLIYRKKQKIFSSFRNLNSLNTTSSNEERSKSKQNLSIKKNKIEKGKKINKNRILISLNKTNISGKKKENKKALEIKKENKTENKKEKYKFKPLKNSIIELSNKNRKLYSPQISSPNLYYNKFKNINLNKSIFNKSFSISINDSSSFSGRKKHISRNLSYNRSLNKKKDKFFKRKDVFPTRTLKLKKTEKTEKSNNKKKEKNNININKLIKGKEEKQKINSIYSKNKKSDKNIMNITYNRFSKNNRTYSDLYKSLNKLNKIKFKIKNSFTTFDSSKYIKRSTSQKSKTNKTLNYLSSNRKNYSKKIIDSNIKNQRTTRIVRKKIIHSKGILNQKRNLYSFNKKTKNKNFSFRNSISSDLRKESNNSFRGFSSSKKLEQIKKKYRFLPQTKEKKKHLKERNINYIEESKGFAKLISSANLIDDTFEEDKNKLINNEDKDKDNKENTNNNKNEKSNEIEYNIVNLNCLNNKEQAKNEKIKEIKDININFPNYNKEDIKNPYSISNIFESNFYSNENDEFDLLNNKSFILDLNNVIPINDKESEYALLNNNNDKKFEKNKNN